jgi:hydroxyacyl-ACP dehydratase HTD2-like protein with hotdog domain
MSNSYASRSLKYNELIFQGTLEVMLFLKNAHRQKRPVRANTIIKLTIIFRNTPFTNSVTQKDVFVCAAAFPAVESHLTSV